MRLSCVKAIFLVNSKNISLEEFLEILREIAESEGDEDKHKRDSSHSQ